MGSESPLYCYFGTGCGKNNFLILLVPAQFYNFNSTYTAGIYLLKVSNKNTRIRCEICSKLTIKIPERRQWRYSGIFTESFVMSGSKINHIKTGIRKVDHSFTSDPFTKLSSRYTHSYIKKLKKDIFLFLFVRKLQKQNLFPFNSY